MNILALLTEGRAAEQADHAVKERAKRGILRGGNAGMIDDAGRWYGKCGRISHLRSLGIEEVTPPHAPKLRMFNHGYAVEDVVGRLLGRGWAGRVQYGPTAVALEHTLPSGVKIGASPDAVLSLNETLVAGVEVKSIASIWTAKGVHFEIQPKSDHLIQAGLYSLLMNRLPWTILYCSWVDWHLSTAPKWLQDKFTPGTPGVDFKDGKPFKIVPFERAYTLSWSRDGYLQYHSEGMPEPCTTLVNETAIFRYYETVGAIGATKRLTPRPTVQGVDGSKSYKACDYCPLAATCDAHETAGYDTWLDQATSVLTTPKVS